MTEFSKNLRKLMGMAGLTQRELARDIGVSNQLVSKWLSGEVAAPRGDKLDALAAKFGLRRPFDVMNAGGVDYLLGEVIAESPAVYTATTKAPLYGRIAAGRPIAADRVEDFFWVPPEVLQEHPRGFYLRVDGESMNRLIPDGSLAFVDPDCEVRNGDIGALHVNGHDATIKRVMRGATKLMLVPESFDPEFHDMVFDLSDAHAETVTIIGRVVWFTRPYESGCL